MVRAVRSWNTAGVAESRIADGRQADRVELPESNSTIGARLAVGGPPPPGGSVRSRSRSFRIPHNPGYGAAAQRCRTADRPGDNDGMAGAGPSVHSRTPGTRGSRPRR